MSENKGPVTMTEKERQIFEVFRFVIPKLSESDKSYLLGMGEGMAIKVKAAGKGVGQ